MELLWTEKIIIETILIIDDLYNTSLNRRMLVDALLHVLDKLLITNQT